MLDYYRGPFRPRTGRMWHCRERADSVNGNSTKLTHKK